MRGHLQRVQCREITDRWHFALLKCLCCSEEEVYVAESIVKHCKRFLSPVYHRSVKQLAPTRKAKNWSSVKLSQARNCTVFPFKEDDNSWPADRVIDLLLAPVFMLPKEAANNLGKSPAESDGQERIVFGCVSWRARTCHEQTLGVQGWATWSDSWMGNV